MSRKRFTLFAAILLALAGNSAFAFDPYIVPDINIGGIVGTWTLRLGAVRHTIAFDKTGTFRGTCFMGQNIEDEYEGTWTSPSFYIGNPVLKYVYTKSRRIAVGTKDQDTIERLNDMALWVITKNGRNDTRRIWTRISEKK